MTFMELVYAAVIAFLSMPGAYRKYKLAEFDLKLPRWMVM